MRSLKAPSNRKAKSYFSTLSGDENGGLLSGKYRVTNQGIQSQDGTSRMDNPDMQQFAQNPGRANRVIGESYHLWRRTRSD
jgi:hypothetical protein